MKKNILTTIIVSLAIVLSSVANVAHAQIPQLLPDIPGTKEASKINLVKYLPSGGWEMILANIIKLILSIVGPIAFISFIVGGVMMITAHDNEERIRKGKNILLWSVLALAIIAASYAIITGITQLQFIQPK